MRPIESAPRLSLQARRVLHLIAAGCSTKQIAFRLGTSEQTVKWHIARLLVAFDVPNRAALVHTAATRGRLRRLPTTRRSEEAPRHCESEVARPEHDRAGDAPCAAFATPETCASLSHRTAAQGYRAR